MGLGTDCALVVGGHTQEQFESRTKLVLKCEIIDTVSAKSYYPKSRSYLPDDCKEILGLFKIAQEVEETMIN